MPPPTAIYRRRGRLMSRGQAFPSHGRLISRCLASLHLGRLISRASPCPVLRAQLEEKGTSAARRQGPTGSCAAGTEQGAWRKGKTCGYSTAWPRRIQFASYREAWASQHMAALYRDAWPAQHMAASYRGRLPVLCFERSSKEMARAQLEG